MVGKDLVENSFKKVKRYYSSDKRKALYWMNEKNKIAEKGKRWRVGMKITNRIIFDIDNPEIDNLLMIEKYYSRYYMTTFKCYKTFSGFHLISDKIYNDRTIWLLDVCRMVYPSLEPGNLVKYVDAIHKFYAVEYGRQQKDKLERQTFLDELPKRFKESGLFSGLGDFDILFVLNAIMKERFILRITKKGKNDRPQLINTNKLIIV